MPKAPYTHLLSPGMIGAMRLRNRIIVTAMGVSFAEPDGSWGPRLRAYHERQAQGGAALINMGATGVSWPAGGVQRNQVALSDDRYIPGAAATAEAVHRHGAKLSVQLHHAGPNSINDMIAGRPVYVPSPPELIPGGYHSVYLPEEAERSDLSKIGAVDYRTMSIDDIRMVIEHFAVAADRAKRAGLDGVELHGGHGYLISSFLSPKANRRTDDYGGTLESRARLMTEIIRAVRSAVGSDFPVWIKIDSREVDKPGGITIDDAIATARLAQAAGVDAITVSAYHAIDRGKRDAGSHTPQIPAVNLPYTERIKAAIGIPVIASGRIEPEVGDAAIATGKADFIAMGRKLLADPSLPAKLEAGRAADILPCIYCYTCISAIFTSDPSRCAVNPETGFEYLDTPVQSSAKRIVVIGGGPAGMEAARRLDIKGHNVTLIEGSNQLGGTLRFASLAYEPNERLLDWLKRQVEQSKIDVRLGTLATPESIAALSPEMVIVATGAIRAAPSIPGADLDTVFSGDDLRRLMLGEDSEALSRKTGLGSRLIAKAAAVTGLSANIGLVRQATRQWMPLGMNIVIIGSGLVGMELAEFLTERDRKVTIVDDDAFMGRGLPIMRRMWVSEELKDHGVPLELGVTDLRIEESCVRFTTSAGAARTIPMDNVIIAKGAAGERSLADALLSAGLEVRVVGDAAVIGYIEGAMRGAADAARDL